MGRLTERNPGWLGEEFWTSARAPDDGEIDDVYERLKYYEDLEESGRLVVLPEGYNTECLYDALRTWEAALKGVE